MTLRPHPGCIYSPTVLDDSARRKVQLPMLTALQIIAERKIEEFFQSDRVPDLSHWKNRPLPVEDLSNVPADLRLAYKILKNAGYVPEEVALRKEIARTEDLLTHCRDEKVKFKQLKKLSYLQFKLECRMGRSLILDSDSPYYPRVVEKIPVRDKEG